MEITEVAGEESSMPMDDISVQLQEANMKQFASKFLADWEYRW
jgi:hypothetical protein